MAALLVQMTTVDLPSADRTLPVEVVLPLTRQSLMAAASKKFKSVTKQSRIYHGITGAELIGKAEIDGLQGAFVVFSGKGGWKGAARLSAGIEEAAAVADKDAVADSVAASADALLEEDAVQACIDDAALLEAARTERSSGVVLSWRETQNNGYLSNWAMSPLEISGVRYNCVEQSIMAAKARACKDEVTLQKIMQAKTPRKQKGLGRSLDAGAVSRFWRLSQKVKAQVQGARAKFSQNHALAAKLLRTGEKLIAEASPSDCIFGIGLAPDDPLAQDPANWRGQNILGKALMEVRAELRRRILSGDSLMVIGKDAADLVEEADPMELQLDVASVSSEQDEGSDEEAAQAECRHPSCGH